MGIGAVLPAVLPASPFEGAVQIANPAWFEDHDGGTGLLDDARRMAFVDELGEQGYTQGDGDGWAAAIVDEDTGAVLSAAVGRELTAGDGPDLFADPSAMALLVAQQRLQGFSLAGRPLVLVTNRPLTPLAFGQGTWSGVRAVLCPQADSQELVQLYSGGPTWRDILANSPSRTIVRHSHFRDEGPRPRREGDDWRRPPRVMLVSQEAVLETAEPQPSPDWRRGAVHLEAPSWLPEMASRDWVATTAEQRLGLAIELSHRNIQNGGGPFGAALYDRLGRVYAVGMNRVVPQNSSILHAEGMAYLRALARYWTEEYLPAVEGGADVNVMGGLRLATSCDPCVQCYMATLALARYGLVVGMDHAAHADDARAIGFDEGVLPDDPWSVLADRHVRVSERSLRDEAKAVLVAYKASSGTVYNADTVPRTPVLTPS